MPLGVGLGDDGARFAEPEAPVPEEPLALAHAEREVEAALDVGGQRLAVPDGAGEARVGGGLPEHPLEMGPLGRREPRGPAGTVVLAEALEAVVLEAVHPVLHGAGRIAEDGGDLGARDTMGDHQQTVEPMVIARLGGAPDFVLEAEDDGRVGQGEVVHTSIIPPCP